MVIAGRFPSEGVGHVYLIYGYSYNRTIEEYQFDIYDPLYSDERAAISRTYAWICDGSNGHNSEPKDGRMWEWTVTYRIGDYGNTIPVS